MGTVLGTLLCGTRRRSSSEKFGSRTISCSYCWAAPSGITSCVLTHASAARHGTRIPFRVMGTTARVSEFTSVMGSTVGSTGGHGHRLPGADSPPCQFRISVIGTAVASPTGWLIRNRPSRATAYCARLTATVPPPTMPVGNSGTGVPAQGVV